MCWNLLIDTFTGRVCIGRNHIRNIIFGTHFFHVRHDCAEVFPWHVCEEVVLNLEVQARKKVSGYAFGDKNTFN